MSGDNLTRDREGWPLRIPEYVFETAAQAASFPAATASKPWFRAAVESAFMNGHQKEAKELIEAANGGEQR